MTAYIEGTEVDNDSLPMVLFENFFSTGSVTASTEATGFDASNAYEESTFDFWKPTTTTATYETDLGSADFADCLAVVAHDLGTQNATFKVQYASTATADILLLEDASALLLEGGTDNLLLEGGAEIWNDLAEVSPTDDSTILVVFDRTEAIKWRFNLTASDAAPTIGVLMLGERLVFSNGLRTPYTPMWLSKNIELLGSQTIEGQFIGNRVLRRGLSTEMNLNILDRTFIETTIQDFKDHYDDGKAFIWASAPATFSEDVAYAWRSSGAEMRPTFQDNGLFYIVQLSVEGYAD